MDDFANSTEDMQLDNEYVMPTFKRYPVEFVRGEGMHLYDASGKRYLDFLSGIGVCSLGHCAPELVSAITEQAQTLIHVSNYFYIEKRGQVAKKLASLLSRDDATTKWKTFFANSGAEANECAIKLARLHYNLKNKSNEAQGTPIIIALKKSFHGRTMQTLSATGQPRLHSGFEPIAEGFVYTEMNDTSALEKLFDAYSSRICGVIIECIQGESGVNVCDKEYVQRVRELCTKTGALMICDEVQCGLFRTGKPFGFQHFGITPDVVTMAKGIASGIPAGACAARSQFANEMGAGLHGSTFGGSNIAMSASLATLNALDSAQSQQQITEAGAYLREKLEQLPQVVSTRGIGLMIAAELQPGLDAHDVATAALAHGLVVNAPTDTALRLLPPLICTHKDVDEFITLLAQALN